MQDSNQSYSPSSSEPSSPFSPSFQLPSPFQQSSQGFHSVWKTNMLLPSQVERVAERNQQFKRRTSFEDNLINQQIDLMIKTIVSTDLEIKNCQVPRDDRKFAKTKENKQLPEIEQNVYLTEEQKYQYTGTVLNHQDNFSIVMRLGSVLKQNKQELFYILFKILNYTTSQMSLPTRSTTQTVQELLETHKQSLLKSIVDQQNIKVINPLFFSNVNEVPLMRVVQGWFCQILCIKIGVYESMEEEYEEDTKFQEEENLFMESQ